MKTWAYRLKAGFLVGVETAGAPCGECAGLWLSDRKVEAEPVKASSVKERKELVKELRDLKDACVAYEIDDNGSATKLELWREPHPNCNCGGKPAGARGIEPGRLNFALSSAHKIQCARYSTPSGNLWLTKIAFTGGEVRFGVAPERNASRWSAYHTSETELQLQAHGNAVVSMYSQSNKQPMLVVGASNWIRNKVPFFLLQQFDVHLFLFPNSGSAWVVGAYAISRTDVGAQAHWSIGTAQEINAALSQALQNLMVHCQPADWSESVAPQAEPSVHAEKIAKWRDNWVYRCPKISLKDVLHLETYTTLENLKSAEQVDAPAPFRLVAGGKL